MAMHARRVVLALRRLALGGTAAVVFATAAPADAAPNCAALEHADGRPLPVPSVCVARFGVAPPADAGAAARRKAADALFAAAKQADDAGRFDEAEAAIDCADAVLGSAADALAREELLRQRGVLDYHRERIPQALSRFECGLQRSTAREDRTAIARDLKNVGSALRRLGDYRGALAVLIRSLEMQRAAGGEVQPAVLNNLGDVYRALGERDQAEAYYRETLAVLEKRGDAKTTAHVRETLAELALDHGDARAARPLLEAALRAYRDAGKRTFMLRAYAGLVRTALLDGDTAAAQRFVADAFALADAHHLPLPADLQREAARVDRALGRLDAAETRLQQALAALPERDAERASLLEALAETRDAQGRHDAAFATLREAHAQAERLAQARQDQQLDWLRTRFETAERDRTIAALESENRLRRAELRQRTLLLWLTVAVAACVALLIRTGLQRRRQRERLLEATRQVRHEEELARYRREAEALAEDRSLLQALLDSRGDAVCLLDADGHLLAANRAACDLLGIDAARPAGPALADLLAADDRAPLAEALERMEDATAQTLPVAVADGRRLQARLSPWERGDGLVVLALVARAGADDASPDVPAATDTAPATAAAPSADAGADDLRGDFRRALVELMLAAVDTWERSTGTSRLELAEKSRLWRVTIDDGRLRTRAMERYLSLSKLPRNPRWRDVLRTAYHVLGQCALEPEARAALQARVDAVLAWTRRDALV
jgi:PAS domain S-box-containing protein